MTSPISAVLSWTTSSRRFWVRWHRTMRLRATVRRLRRQVSRAQRQLALRLEMLQLMEQLEHPMLLLPAEHLPSDSPTPTSEPTPLPPEPPLPPPLTEEERAALMALPMPDPLEEIEHRLGLSTSPPSSQTSPA